MIYIYQIIGRFLFGIIVFLIIFFLLIKFGEVSFDKENIDFIEVLLGLGGVSALLGFWKSVVDRKNDYNLSNKPILKLFGFDGDQVTTNHSEKGDPQIKTCPEVDCSDIHLVNIRHINGMDIKIKSIGMNKDKEGISEKTYLELNSDGILSKGWEYQLQSGGTSAK